MKLRLFSAPLVLGLCSFVALANGCGDDSGSGDGTTTQGAGNGSNGGEGTGNAGGTGGGGGTGNTGLEGPENCAEGEDFTDAPDNWDSETVTANVIGIDGEPAAGVLTQICGINICIAIANTDAGGNVLLDNGEVTEMDTPAFKVGDGLDYAKLAHILPQGMLDHEYEDALAIGMTDTGMAFPIGGEVSGGGVSLLLEADGVAVVDPLLFPEPAQQTFRVMEVPGPLLDQVAEPSVALLAAFGLGPIDTKLCPPAEITVPNTPELDPGTAVDFILHGTEVGEEFAPYGGWARVSGGTVSADGTTIVSNAGEGIPVLGLIGVRLAE